MIAELSVLASAAYLPGESGGTGGTPDPPAERAHEVLGRRGLVGTDAATRLALCATHRVLGRADRQPRPTGPADPRVAVVASSNLGSVAAVRGVARAVAVGGLREVSPLQAPNVSSNVVAAAVARWFRCAGPNLMVCSGATGGLDAFAVAGRLVRAGRADRVVVVGVEPDDPDAVAVYGAPLRAAAASVVVGAPVPGPGRGRLFLGPVRRAPEPPGATAAGPAPTYGAHGVLAVAAAAARLRAGEAARAWVLSGSGRDGWKAVDLWLQ